MLAAGAVLTKDLPANEVWGGNPATFMMTRQAYEEQRGDSMTDERTAVAAFLKKCNVYAEASIERKGTRRT